MHIQGAIYYCHPLMYVVFKGVTVTLFHPVFGEYPRQSASCWDPAAVTHIYTLKIFIHTHYIGE